MAKLGVSLDDAFTAIGINGSVEIDDFNLCGQTWQVKVAIDTSTIKEAADIGKLMVRGVDGKMVALSRFATVRKTEQVEFLDRLNMYPAVEVTANVASGASLAQVRTLCETLMEKTRKELGLTGGYRLQWF